MVVDPDERRLLSTSPAATEALAEALGAKLPPGALVLLDGELGSGKTCFVRGLARGLGVTERISSPTYALMHSYPGRIELLHFDAWMEGRERAFLADGGLASLDSGSVAVVEWGARVRDVLPTPRIQVELAHAGPEARSLRLWVEGAEAGASVLRRTITELALPPGMRAD